MLLIGLRFEQRWAGGSGPVEPCVAVDVNSGQKITRGQFMTTSQNQFSVYKFCDDTLVYLDQNTQIELSRYRNPNAQTATKLELVQGRVILDGYAETKTRALIGIVDGGTCEFVHYSWRDELDITPFSNQSCGIDQLDLSLPVLQTTRLNTFGDGHSIIRVTPFQATTSAAAAFYTWTGLDLKTLR